MNAQAIKIEVDQYLPLLSNKQQILVLEMIKNLLNVDTETTRISKKQYNQEINEAVDRINNGNEVSEEEAEMQFQNLLNK